MEYQIPIMKKIILIFSLFVFSAARAGDSLYTIKINFLYGSRPAKGYKDSESRLFGGIKGGHVNIEAGGRILDFVPGNNPLFPNNKNPTGGFKLRQSIYWDIERDKWASVTVPVSEDQYTALQFLFDEVSKETPYDYAILGMRCAAASYDILCKIGLFKEYSNKKDIAKFFYPKLLRRKIFQWAEENNYKIKRYDGRSSRKWESDKGLF